MSWAPMVFGLLGGLALFLFGMEEMTGALKLAAGPRMSRLLGRMTTNRFTGALTGAFVTAVIQSSSVTTVLLVGFVSAGLMSLRQSIGVIMGANIGSTVTAQVIAFQVTGLSTALIAGGFALKTLVRDERLRQLGGVILGLGLLFLGMTLMTDATRPLRSWPEALQMMQGLRNPLAGVMIGAAFTALVQSSAATTGIIIALAGAGLLPLEAGIAIALGANIGTCITAWLAAIGKRPEARQAAVVHIVFNVVGVALWVGVVDHLADLVRILSPRAPELEGVARMAAETPRQLANAHTLFNVANTLLLIGFVGPLGWLSTRLVPSRRDEASRADPVFLDEAFLDAPALALERVHLEITRIGGFVLEMVREAPPLVIDGDRQALRRIADKDDDVDRLHAAIVAYLGRLSESELGSRETARLADSLAVAHYVESIGDTIETNLVALGLDRVQLGVSMSRGARDGIRPLYEEVVASVERALDAHRRGDAALAQQVVATKGTINRLAEQAAASLTGWRVADDRDRLNLFRIETDVIENLKRMFYFAKKIAKIVGRA